MAVLFIVILFFDRKCVLFLTILEKCGCYFYCFIVVWTGSASTLYDSVHTKILSLPPDTSLYPAHDYTGKTRFKTLRGYTYPCSWAHIELLMFGADQGIHMICI